MPNWVDQKLTIVGTKVDVEAFVVTARGASPVTGDEEGCNNISKLSLNELSFHLIAPLTDDFSRRPYGDRDSYGINAQRDGWSVKWGACECSEAEITHDGLRATYSFQCAWSPPVKALQRASLRYRSLLLILSWGGEGPCRGRHCFKAGKVVHRFEDVYAGSMGVEYDEATEKYGEDSDESYAAHQKIESAYIDVHEKFVESVRESGWK